MTPGNWIFRLHQSIVTIVAMTAPLTHHLHQSRVHDFRRATPPAHRAPRPTAEATTVMQTAEQPIAIRRATAADRAVVARLAALDSADVPAGDVLIAFVGDEPQAATEIATGPRSPTRSARPPTSSTCCRSARGTCAPPPPRRRLGVRRPAFAA